MPAAASDQIAASRAQPHGPRNGTRQIGVYVPAISRNGGRDLVNGGKARAKALADDYTAKRYHQPDDEWNSSWNLTGMVQDAQLLHRVGRDLANSASCPNWSEDSEFRGARDATSGGGLAVVAS